MSKSARGRVTSVWKVFFLVKAATKQYLRKWGELKGHKNILWQQEVSLAPEKYCICLFLQKHSTSCIWKSEITISIFKCMKRLDVKSMLRRKYSVVFAPEPEIEMYRHCRLMMSWKQQEACRGPPAQLPNAHNKTEYYNPQGWIRK